MELIGENLGNNLSSLGNYETYYREGDRGEVRLYLNENLSPEKIQQLQDEIVRQGVVLTEPITQVVRCIYIRFEKRIAPLAIIAIVVGGVAVIASGLIGWQLSKEPLGIPWWVWLIGGGALLYLLFRKPAAKAAGLAIQAGKVYVTRKAIHG